MLNVKDIMGDFSVHMQGVLTVFITSFANFSTVGMIIGCFKSIVDEDKNDLISRNVGYMLLSGILVSLLSAGIAGLFIW
jgi:nucleoside permease NupC